MKTAILHNIEETITTATEKLTPARELSLAITKLQEAYFWFEQTKLKSEEPVSEAM